MKEYPHRYVSNLAQHIGSGSEQLITVFREHGEDTEAFYQHALHAWLVGRALWASLQPRLDQGVRHDSACGDSFYVWRVYPKATPDDAIEADFPDAYHPPPSAYDCTGRWSRNNVLIEQRGSRKLATQGSYCDV